MRSRLSNCRTNSFYLKRRPGAIDVERLEDGCPVIRFGVMDSAGGSAWLVSEKRRIVELGTMVKCPASSTVSLFNAYLSEVRSGKKRRLRALVTRVMTCFTP